MIVVYLILGLIVSTGVVLAVEMLRLGRATPKFVDPETIRGQLTKPFNYEAMGRLFSPEDARLTRADPRLYRRFRAERKKTMRLFLRQLRGDFVEAWSICRLLTPVSGDHDFAAMLMRRWLSFHLCYSLMTVGCALGLDWRVEGEVRKLVGSLTELREGARNILLSADPAIFQTTSA